MMHEWSNLTNEQRERLVRVMEIWECRCNHGMGGQMALELYNEAKRIHDERDEAEIRATMDA